MKQVNAMQMTRYTLHNVKVYIRALNFAQKYYSKFVCLLILIFEYIRIYMNNILIIKCLL